MPAERPEKSERPGVLIAGDFGFPYGTGASSRVFNYARGLQAAGARVKVLCVEPSEHAETPLNTDARGTYRGVPFEYTYGRTARPPARVQRRLLKVAKWWRFLRSVRAFDAAGDGVDAVIIYSRSTAWILAARLACEVTGALLIHEDCELPFVWKRETASLRARRWLYEYLVFKTFDGCLVISSYLRDYCHRHLRRGARTLLVPILVDVSDFAAADEGEGVEERIVFCGSLSHPEVRTVIESFADLAPDYPGLELLLVGGSVHPEVVPDVWDLTRRLGVAERVRSTGKVKRDELPAILRSARVLVLPRPAGAFSDAGLPTKVGEYLATGRPVVMTRNGDIARYLEDGIDAFLVAPDDSQAFTDAVRYVLEHEREASEVGAHGCATAAARFDPSRHGERIVEFIAELTASQRRLSGGFFGRPRPASVARDPDRERSRS
jgi:glycosyltransferase involved in cell wall biosynthesis